MKPPSIKTVAIGGGAGMAGIVMTGVIQLYSMYLDSQERVQVTRTAAFEKAKEAGSLEEELVSCRIETYKVPYLKTYIQLLKENLELCGR